MVFLNHVVVYERPNRRLWRVETMKDTTPTVILSMSFVGDMIEQQNFFLFPIQDFFCWSKLRDVKKIPDIIKDMQILVIIEMSLSDTSYRDTHQDQQDPRLSHLFYMFCTTCW